MISLLLFYKYGLRFIWGHTIMHVLPLLKRIQDGLHLLSCACQNVPFGVGWKGIFSSYIFTLAYGSVGSSPEIFCFTRCILRQFGYLISLAFSDVSILENLLRALLCSWVSLWLFRVLTFSEGAPKWSGELEGTLWATWSLGYVIIFLAVSLLSSGCLVHLVAIVWQRSCGVILVPWGPSDKGDPRFFGGNDSLLQAMSLGVGYLPPCIIIHYWRRSLG